VLASDRIRYGGSTWIGTRSHSWGTNDSGTVQVGGTGSVPINSAGSEDQIRRAYSSEHSGGIQVVLCDASVQFITDGIDHNTDTTVNSVFERLIARNDNAALGDLQ
jgi:hypothetical protein